MRSPSKMVVAQVFGSLALPRSKIRNKNVSNAGALSSKLNCFAGASVRPRKLPVVCTARFRRCESFDWACRLLAGAARPGEGGCVALVISESHSLNNRKMHEGAEDTSTAWLLRRAGADGNFHGIMDAGYFWVITSDTYSCLLLGGLGVLFWNRTKMRQSRIGRWPTAWSAHSRGQRCKRMRLVCFLKLEILFRNLFP